MDPERPTDVSADDASPTRQYADLLAGVPIFTPLDRVTLARLAAQLEPRQMSEGTVLFLPGDPPDGLYIVVAGSFSIYADTDDGEGIYLGTFEAGEYFGEMSLLNNEPRTTTVVADGDGEVLWLERARFYRLLTQEPAVALTLGTILSRRLRQADYALRRFGISIHAQDLPTPEVRPPFLPARGARTAGATLDPVAVSAEMRIAGVPRSTLGMLLAGVALLAGWYVPPPAGLDPVGWHALATLVAIVPLLAFNALPEGLVALALAVVWVVGGIAAPQIAFGGFATPSWVLVVSVLILGSAIAATGLLYRLALWAVARAPGNFFGQALALALSGLAISPTVPNATGRVTLVAPATTELVGAMGYQPMSRPAAGLAMATLLGFGKMAAPFLTSSSTAILVFAVLPEAAREGLNWWTWAVRAVPTHLLLLGGLLAAVLWLYRPRQEEQSARAAQPHGLALQRALLGPPSRQERAVLLVGGAMLLGFVSQPLHGLEAAWIAVMALVALAASGALSGEALRGVNWNFVLLFGVLASMPRVLGDAGLDDWLGQLVVGAMSDVVAIPVAFVALVALLSFAVSLVLRWQAAAPLITIALAPVAAGAGIDPWVVAIVALIACNGFLWPYQSTIYLALYYGTGGRLFSHEQARPIAIAYSVIALVAVCASVPLWHAMGLL